MILLFLCETASFRQMREDEYAHVDDDFIKRVSLNIDVPTCGGYKAFIAF